MAKRHNKRLTESFIRGLSEPGIHGDGRGGWGLKIRAHRTVAGHLTLSWVQQVRIDGKVTALGLGRWPLVALEDARMAAMENAIAIHRGQDPRKRPKLASGAPAAPVTVPVEAPAIEAPTFLEAIERVIEQRRAGWKNGATEDVWRSTLQHVGRLGGMPVSAITARDVSRVIEPLHGSKPTVAARLLSYVDAAMRWALAHDHRSDNPVEKVRASLGRVKRVPVKRRKAIPHTEAASMFRALAGLDGNGARVAQFVMLTAVRVGEAIGARWSEINFDARTWTVPADRMKTGVEHRVPLSDAALRLLDAMPREGELVFPNTRGQLLARPMPNRALRKLGSDATVHGFRSTFRNWCAETGVRREVAERALAHTVKGVESSYNRTDLLDARRDVMEAYSLYVAH